MNRQSIEGFRVGFQDATKYEGNNMELRAHRRHLRKVLMIIRARRCMRTRGKVYTKEYKIVRKGMSDVTIIKRYNEIKEELEIVEVRRYK